MSPSATFPANLDFVRNLLEFCDPLIGVILRAVKAQILPRTARLIGMKLTAAIALDVVGSCKKRNAGSKPTVLVVFLRLPCNTA